MTPLTESKHSDTLWLSLEVSPGSHINHTCRDAVRIANRLGLTVWFDFNGVHCGARPGDDWELLVANVQDAMENKRSLACANPRDVNPSHREVPASYIDLLPFP